MEIIIAIVFTIFMAPLVVIIMSREIYIKDRIPRCGCGEKIYNCKC